MKAKNIFHTISYVMSAFGIIALLYSYLTYGSFVKAAGSVKKLNDHFYYMEFKGETQLKEFLNRGGASTNTELAVYIENLLKGKRINKVYKEQIPLNTGCASLSAITPSGDYVFGRNYDWDDLTAAMIIHSVPKHGYKSISTVQLDFLGFGENFKPETFGNRYLSIAGLFVPLDGMNEKGLCISDLMAGDDEATNQTGKQGDVTTTLAIRGILDYCADVPEAIAFLEKYNMNSVIGKAHHFAISDTQGRMVVVEYVGNKMYVTEAKAITNHYLAKEKSTNFRENSVYRLGVLNDKLDEKNGELSEDEVMDVLSSIRASQYNEYGKTWWSAVFNQSNLTVSYTLEEKYGKENQLSFKL